MNLSLDFGSEKLEKYDDMYELNVILREIQSLETVGNQQRKMIQADVIMLISRRSWIVRLVLIVNTY